MRSFIFIIYGCLLIGLFGCSNSSHFAKRKYLPNFKGQQELKARAIAVNESIDSLSTKNKTVSNYPSRTFDKTVAIKKVKKPTVTKKYPEYATLNLSDNLLITDTVKTEEYYQQDYKPKKTLAGKLIIAAVMLYVPYVIPLLIKHLEGQTTRQVHAKRILIIFLISILILAIAALLGLFAMMMLWFAGYTIHPLYFWTLLYLFTGISIAYLISSYYLGLKAVILN
ncbi:MAG: hypothetical protein P1U44_03670 [Vicingaceae bacterium]|nr:hypothetical protein [Flavobacteriales bacterium]MBL1233900.1 hypothetical protein [Flavobacteriales bacterium]MDF1674793.1 hypothetical protein [Vicingaceae bacterium]